MTRREWTDAVGLILLLLALAWLLSMMRPHIESVYPQFQEEQ